MPSASFLISPAVCWASSLVGERMRAWTKVFTSVIFVKEARQRKGSSPPRLGAANDVPSLQKGGDGAFLHRRRNILSSLMESFNKEKAQSQIEQNYLAWGSLPSYSSKFHVLHYILKTKSQATEGPLPFFFFIAKGRCFHPLTTPTFPSTIGTDKKLRFNPYAKGVTLMISKKPFS